MSVIAAKVEKTRITVASDSIVLKGDMKRTNFSKLRRIGDTICGGCGPTEELCLFFEFCNIEKLTTCTISGVQQYMLAFANFKEQHGCSPKVECAYVIVQDGHLFEIDEMFVQEVFEYTAIGEGECYALTALHLGHTVTESVKAACDLCCFVSEPINVLVHTF